jgi:hypothetical protein
MRTTRIQLRTLSVVPCTSTSKSSTYYEVLSTGMADICVHKSLRTLCTHYVPPTYVYTNSLPLRSTGTNPRRRYILLSYYPIQSHSNSPPWIPPTYIAVEDAIISRIFSPIYFKKMNGPILLHQPWNNYIIFYFFEFFWIFWMLSLTRLNACFQKTLVYVNKNSFYLNTDGLHSHRKSADCRFLFCLL